MNTRFQRFMRDAARLTRTDHLVKAAEAFQRALKGAAGAAGVPAHMFEGRIFDTEDEAKDGMEAASPGMPGDGAPAGRAAVSAGPAGRFTDGRFVHEGVVRHYKLYVPDGRAGQALPLVVMLHGCTQNPDDFAAGTGMNALADELGFVVLYPAQSSSANPQGCWNWFEHGHQQRGSGEPAALAAMTHAVIQAQGIDRRRVFIAGLSAGGAMADIVAHAYPDVFAAAGVHSGLPCGSAGNVAEAFSAMSGGASDSPSLPGAGWTPPVTARPASDRGRAVPVIVFHGDKDRTVHPRNGEQVVAAALARASGDAAHRRMSSQQGVSDRGRRYTRTVHGHQDGKALAEHWVVHGAGHAWSGGQAAGTYTDASGPDATREMLRFFFEQTPAPGA
jgi:poly(hydroxyalkanoate) depolymerase family esterase